MTKLFDPEAETIVDATPWLHLEGSRLETERANLAEDGWPGLTACAERVVVRADGRVQYVTHYGFVGRARHVPGT